MRTHTTGATKGFTLVELIIVIIILGILAALAIPQFTSSTTDAKESTLKADLAVLRSAISLYYHEHNNVYPGATKSDGSAGAGTAADLTNQLQQFSDRNGKTNATKTTLFPYGPYVQAIPSSPVQTNATAPLVVVGATTLTPFDNASHWFFNTTSGEVRANSTATGSSGTAYSTY